MHWTERAGKPCLPCKLKSGRATVQTTVRDAVQKTVHNYSTWNDIHM